MTVAPLIAMKSTKCESLEAVGKELDRRAHTYDPEDGWWVEVDSDGSELPGDWEYDRKGGYVYCSFS